MQAFSGLPAEWNTVIAGLPNPHLLQTWEWAQVKAKYGWQQFPLIWKDGNKVIAAAMVLKRAMSMRGFSARLSVLYAPKGPNLDWENTATRQRVLDDLQGLARKQGAIFLKIDPDVVLGTEIPGSERESVDNAGFEVKSDLTSRGWVFSSDQIQFRNTVMLDVTRSEDEMLSLMKQKTRYNIRLAGRKGVTVRTGEISDMPMLYRMYVETSLRDGFVVRDETYYKAVWEGFMRQGMAKPLIAEVDGDPVAAVFVFWFAGRAYYLYGMSREVHREKMPNYLLQWEAMLIAKSVGCSVYDLWGAPDVFDNSDPMWGVYRFKEGLGGQVVRTLGAWDFVPNKLWYRMYTEILPRLLDVMRSRGRARTKQALE